MATKRKIYIPCNLATAAGATTLVDLPLYYDYHSIGFEYVDNGAAGAAFTAPHIVYSTTGNLYTGGVSAGGILGDVALKVNADVKRIHSAQELDRLNGVNGTLFQCEQIVTGTVAGGVITPATGSVKQVLKLHFAEPWRTDKNDRLACVATMTPAFGVNSAQLQITLGQALPATGTLLIYAVVDTPTATVPKTGPLVKLVQRSDIVVAGSAFDYTALNQNGYYQTVLMKQPTGGGYIAKATLKVNGTVLREIDREANIAELLYNTMNPSTSIVAGAFGFDMVLDDDDPLSSALPAAGNNFVLHLDFAGTASGSMRAMIETVQFGW